MRDLPRIPLPTEASSAELAKLPAPLRREALFSARMNRLGPLVAAGAKIKGILDGTVSMSDARKEIREALDAAGYVPPEGAEGGLRDHRSKARLDLILTQNVRKARGYARREADMEILDDWPAQELVRLFQRKAARDWGQRWTAAGGRLYGGRMIAIKTDPIWAAISRFSEPYPPFDYGSGMGLRDIDRGEAEKLGLIGPDDVLTPEEPEYPEVREANMPGVDRMPELQAAVEKAMGGGASFDGPVLRFPTRPAVSGSAGSPESLGLPGLAPASVSRTPPAVRPEEALALIRRGAAATADPDGNKAEIDAETVAHWQRNKPGETRRRLATIRRAFDAVREPQETWERKGRKYYLKATADKDGRMTHTYVIVKDGRVETWVSSSKAGTAENKRGGNLLQRQGE
jgi:hypothetical protein